MLEYQKILNENMLNVFKDILKKIKTNGLSDGNHLYITFLTNSKGVQIPKWLLNQYPEEMTIILQYEYYNLSINEDYFQISLSFNNIKTELKIAYNAIISFADPSANFGLKLNIKELKKSTKRKLNKKQNNNNNIIDFANFKKS